MQWKITPANIAILENEEGHKLLAVEEDGVFKALKLPNVSMGGGVGDLVSVGPEVARRA